MSVVFNFETLSTSGQSVTRQASITLDQASVAPFFSAIQFVFGYESSVIEISERALLPGVAGVSPILNPATTDGMNAADELRVAAISNTGVSSSGTIFELIYTHPVNEDPEFSISTMLVDEDVVVAGTVAASADTSDAPTVTPPTEDVPSVAVEAVLGVSEGNSLYWFANDRVGVSTEIASVGEEITESTILNFRMTGSSFLSAETLIASGVSSLVFRTENGAYVLDLDFQTGASSELYFDEDSGLLTQSIDTGFDDSPTEIPDEDGVEPPLDSGSDLELFDDGLNTGTGISDDSGLNVSLDTISAVLPVTGDTISGFRQRLGEGVALELLNRDNSVVGKIVGSDSSRFVKTVNNGSQELLVDLPAATTLDFLGLASDVSAVSASTYFNGLVTSALGQSAWSSSISASINKALAQIEGSSIDTKVITPQRVGVGDGDEIVISSNASSPELLALNLTATDDLVTLNSFDSVVVVGPGRAQVSGSDAAKAFGDLQSQEITGGSGNDLISGGGGNDRLTGGLGSDTFELGFSGTTAITDLTAADTLRFSLFGVASLDQLLDQFVSEITTDEGLLVTFDNFAVELVGYSSLSQFVSGVEFI